MPRLLRSLLLTLLIVVLLVMALFFTATSDQPLVRRTDQVSQEAVAQARTLWQSHDPRRLAAGEAVVELPFELVDNAFNYITTTRLSARSAIRLDESKAAARFSRSFNSPLGRRFLNLEAVFSETGTLPKLESVRIGALPVPGPLARWAWNEALQKTEWQAQWTTAITALQQVELDGQAQRVRVRFHWDPAFVTQAVQSVIPAEEIARLQRTQTLLVDLLQQNRSGAIPLVRLLPPLLLAEQGGIEQHRAALLVLGSFLIDKPLDNIIPEARNWPMAPPLKIVLHNRHDSAQHFIVSAMLTAWSDQRISDAIGLYKEILDKQQGSGFSFADLAADRAGTRFGELIQQQLVDVRTAFSALDDHHLMPSPQGLPEFLTAADFRDRFGDVNSPAYQRKLSEIEQSLRELPLYR